MGLDENAGSHAVGWVLEQSPAYRELVVRAIFGCDLNSDHAEISLQRHRRDGGFTDIEIQSQPHFHAVMEAKRWWDVPGEGQFRLYVPRLTSGGARLRKLVSISAADATYAARRLAATLDGVDIVHLSWGNLRRLAKQAKSQTSAFEEKLWLRHLISHLQEYESMERRTDNNVYVVALGRQAMVEGQPSTWIDVVERDGCYFHPVGGYWPVSPVNYIGFRYDGKLQSIHHIDGHDVVENLAERNPTWPVTDFDHFVYRLGPAMRPPCDVRTGKIYMTGRVWCAIDTLLSGAYPTIGEARDETKRRLAE